MFKTHVLALLRVLGKAQRVVLAVLLVLLCVALSLQHLFPVNRGAPKKLALQSQMSAPLLPGDLLLLQVLLHVCLKLWP